MTSNIYKLFLIIIFILASSFLFSQKTFANAPEITGRVTATDPANGSIIGVPNVWVKWNDYMQPNCASAVPAQCTNHGTRYAQTDASGKFTFCPFQSIGGCPAVSECAARIRIDTNLDGTDDDYKVTMYDGYQNCTPTNYRGFACNENSHVFSVVKPYNWTGGDFKTSSGESIITINFANNIGGTIDIGSFSWTPHPPTPTLIPTVTIMPSPTMPASCNCDNMDVVGNLAPGQTVSFITTAKVVDIAHNMGRVDKMDFHVEREGQKIADAVDIPALGPTRQPEADYYQAYWNYPIPAQGTGQVRYRVYCDNISCSRRISSEKNQIASILSSVLGINTERKSLIQSILSYFYSIFNKNNHPENADSQTVKIQGIQDTAPPGSILGVNSLQLGTFNPNQDIEKGCKEVSFTVNY